MSKRPARRRQTFECQHCGAEVTVGSKACRECGSDASTGWQDAEQIDYQSLDLPQGYSPEEDHPAAGGGGGFLPEGRSWWFVAVAIVLALGLLALAVLR